jgi:Polyketide cyclase / dehydrase and lipid transport.
MRISVRETVHAPIDKVFEKVCDYAHFERLALRRGADVDHLAGGDSDGVGRQWRVSFTFRGKPRKVVATVAQVERPTRMNMDMESDGLTGRTEVTLSPLAPNRTQLVLIQDLKPKTLAARLMLQSMRLAKGSVEGRLKMRVAEFARGIDGRKPN